MGRLRNTIDSPHAEFLGQEKYEQHMKDLDSDLELLRDGLKRLPVDVQYYIMQNVLSTLNTELLQSGAA